MRQACRSRKWIIPDRFRAPERWRTESGSEACTDENRSVGVKLSSRSHPTAREGTSTGRLSRSLWQLTVKGTVCVRGEGPTAGECGLPTCYFVTVEVVRPTRHRRVSCYSWKGPHRRPTSLSGAKRNQDATRSGLRVYGSAMRSRYSAGGSFDFAARGVATPWPRTRSRRTTSSSSPTVTPWPASSSRISRSAPPRGGHRRC